MHFCQQCNQPASVRVTEVTQGKPLEVHLCDACAQKMRRNTPLRDNGKLTSCSFCAKSSRDVGPMVEGPNNVFICSHCNQLAQNIFQQAATV